MRSLFLILGFVLSVTLNAQAQSQIGAFRTDATDWGVSAKSFANKGFKTDPYNVLVKLEKRANKRSHSERQSSRKIQVMSRQRNASGQQGYLTATFFEDRLERYKETVVFTAAKFKDIVETIRNFEGRTGTGLSVMTEAANLKKNSSYTYLSEDQLSTVKLLFDEERGGGILQIEGRWRRMDNTVRQYEIHLQTYAKR